MYASHASGSPEVWHGTTILTVRKGGKVVITGLIGGGWSTAVTMFPLKAMTIEGTQTGTLAEARELIDLVRTRNIAPPPIAERPLDQASRTLDDLRGGGIVGRVVLTA